MERSYGFPSHYFQNKYLLMTHFQKSYYEGLDEIHWKVIKTRWFWNFCLGDLKNNLENFSSLKGCPLDFNLIYIFEINGFHWSKWAIDCLIQKTFIFQMIQPPASEAANKFEIWKGQVWFVTYFLFGFSWKIGKILRTICYFLTTGSMAFWGRI